VPLAARATVRKFIRQGLSSIREKAQSSSCHVSSAGKRRLRKEGRARWTSGHMLWTTGFTTFRPVPSGDATTRGAPFAGSSQKETAMMNNHVDEHFIETAKEQAHEAAAEAAKEAAQKAYRETYDEVYKEVYPEAYKEALQRRR